MKYLHIGANSRIYTDYIKFIDENFDRKEHKFLYPKENGKNLTENIFIIIKFIVYGLMVKKIFIHGLFNKKMILFLYIFRFFLNKSSWIIWGGDLYTNYFKLQSNSRLTFKEKIYFYIDKKVKKHFKNYITFMTRDYKIMQKYCNGNGKLLLSFTYPSNLYKKNEIRKEKKEELWIQVGNSADPSNNHFEILEKLSKFKDMNIKLFCILSYGGNEEYKKQVIRKGSELFKDKFFPILNFMEFKEYMSFLSSLDIAIFAHNRQQGFGNITSLLSMKKTVYLKETVTTFKTLKEMGIEVKSFEKLINLEKIDENILETNRKIIEENFSEEKLIEQWKNIFEN